MDYKSADELMRAIVQIVRNGECPNCRRNDENPECEAHRPWPMATDFALQTLDELIVDARALDEREYRRRLGLDHNCVNLCYFERDNEGNTKSRTFCVFNQTDLHLEEAEQRLRAKFEDGMRFCLYDLGMGGGNGCGMNSRTWKLREPGTASPIVAVH